MNNVYRFFWVGTWLECVEKYAEMIVVVFLGIFIKIKF